MSTTTELDIAEQILRGHHDASLDHMADAIQRRKRRLKSMEDSPAVTRFIETVRENPGLTTQELADLMDVSLSRVYGLAELSKPHLKPSEDWPRRYDVKDN